MSGREVLIWKPVIVRAAVFRKTFTFMIGTTPYTFTTAEFVITPDNGDPVVLWNQGNGKFTLVGNQYFIYLDEIETASYAWDTGRYALSVEESNGDLHPCLIEGPIRVIDC